MFCPSGLCPLVELSSWPWFSLYVGVSVECFALRYCFAIQTNLRDVFCLQRLGVSSGWAGCLPMRLCCGCCWIVLDAGCDGVISD